MFVDFADNDSEAGYDAKVEEYKQFFKKTENNPPEGGNNP